MGVNDAERRSMVWKDGISIWKYVLNSKHTLFWRVRLNNSCKIPPQASRKTFRGIQANFGGQKWKMGESGSWGDPHFNFYLHFWRNIHTATCPSFALCAMCVTWQNRETLVFILFLYPLIDVPSSYAPFCACQNYHLQIWVSRAIDPQHFLPPLFSS